MYNKIIVGSKVGIHFSTHPPIIGIVKYIPETTGDAWHITTRMGFDFVGMELDENYYKAACLRFEDHKRQGRLFEPC